MTWNSPHEELLRWADFGRWLEAARVERGYSQAFVAGQAGVGVQTLVALEHGGYRRTTDGPWITPNPRDETLVSLARVHRCGTPGAWRRTAPQYPRAGVVPEP